MSLINQRILNNVPKSYQDAFAETLMKQGGESVYMTPIAEEGLDRMGVALMPSRELKHSSNSMVYAVTTPLNNMSIALQRFFVAGDYGRKTSVGVYEEFLIVAYIKSDLYISEFVTSNKTSTLVGQVHEYLSNHFKEFNKAGVKPIVRLGPAGNVGEQSTDKSCVSVMWDALSCTVVFAPVLDADDVVAMNTALGYCLPDTVKVWRSSMEESFCKFTALLPEQWRCTMRMMRHWAMVQDAPMNAASLDTLVIRVYLHLHMEGQPTDPSSVFRCIFKVLHDKNLRLKVNNVSLPGCKDCRSLPEAVRGYMARIQYAYPTYTAQGTQIMSLFVPSLDLMGSCGKRTGTVLSEMGKCMEERVSAPGSSWMSFVDVIPVEVAKKRSHVEAPVVKRSAVGNVLVSIGRMMMFGVFLSVLSMLVAFVITVSTVNEDHTLSPYFYNRVSTFISNSMMALSRVLVDSITPVVESPIYSKLEDKVFDLAEIVADIPRRWDDRMPLNAKEWMFNLQLTVVESDFKDFVYEKCLAGYKKTRVILKGVIHIGANKIDSIFNKN